VPFLGAATRQSRTNGGRMVFEGVRPVFPLWTTVHSSLHCSEIWVNCRIKQATVSGRCNFYKCMTFVVKYT